MEKLLTVLGIFFFSSLSAQNFTAEQISCDVYFSTVFTDFIVNESAVDDDLCESRKRKTYRFSGLREQFDFELAAQGRSAVHFVREPHSTPSRVAGLFAVNDFFRFSFLSDENSTDLEHYFFLADSVAPSLIRVIVEYTRSSVDNRILSTAFKTQHYRYCSVAAQIDDLIRNVECPSAPDACRPLYDPDMNPYQELPNFSEDWVELCPDEFESAFVEVFEEEEDKCELVERNAIVELLEDDFTFSFGMDTTQLVHHFYQDIAEDLDVLKHKRSKIFRGAFTYRIHRAIDKNRIHYFYFVSDKPTLLKVSTFEKFGSKIRYRLTFYKSCDIQHIQKLIVDLQNRNGYCPNDPNPCHR
ncbi:MAG: hypothetical protein AAGI23_08220 [Bacteroidota bacterium]